MGLMVCGWRGQSAAAWEDALVRHWGVIGATCRPSWSPLQLFLWPKGTLSPREPLGPNLGPKGTVPRVGVT